MSRRLAWIIIVGLLAALPLPAPTQEPGSIAEGTHALRAILKQKFKATPLDLMQFDKEARLKPESMLLIVFGDLSWIDRQDPAVLLEFVQRGGALLVASDHKSDRNGALNEVFHVQIAGDFLEVPPSSPAAYRRLRQCPTVRDFVAADHPLFKNITDIATNRPSHLVRGSRSLPPLAWFSSDAHWDQDALPPNQRVARSHYYFAAGAALGQGKVLFVADHSVFINEMMLQTDNHNFFFACNCLDWLTLNQEGKRRDLVLFREDDRVVTDFNFALKEQPPIPVPLPSEATLIEKGNEILAAVDESDVFNRFINDHVARSDLLKVLAVLLTGVLGMWGMYRLARNRHRIERHEPLLAACLAIPAGTGTVVQRRHAALLRQNNYWEAAHQATRQWFLSVLSPSNPGRPGGVPAMLPEPRITVRAGWWRRRVLRRQVRRLWRLASGRHPAVVSDRDFRRLDDELRSLRAALTQGILQLEPAR